MHGLFLLYIITLIRFLYKPISNLLFWSRINFCL